MATTTRTRAMTSALQPRHAHAPRVASAAGGQLARLDAGFAPRIRGHAALSAGVARRGAHPDGAAQRIRHRPGRGRRAAGRRGGGTPSSARSGAPRSWFPCCSGLPRCGHSAGSPAGCWKRATTSGVSPSLSPSSDCCNSGHGPSGRRQAARSASSVAGLALRFLGPIRGGSGALRHRRARHLPARRQRPTDLCQRRARPLPRPSGEAITALIAAAAGVETRLRRFGAALQEHARSRIDPRRLPSIHPPPRAKKPVKTLPAPTEPALEPPPPPVINVPARKPQPAPTDDRRAQNRPACPNGRRAPLPLPDVSRLAYYDDVAPDTADLHAKATLIEETLASFKVEAKVREINPGPAVTQFALEPGNGVKVRRITELQSDLALALAAPSYPHRSADPGIRPCRAGDPQRADRHGRPAGNARITDIPQGEAEAADPARARRQRALRRRRPDQDAAPADRRRHRGWARASASTRSSRPFSPRGPQTI